MQILIGQPLDYPNELISILEKKFNLTGNVKKAYLASLQYSNPKIPPKLLIGLDVIGDINAVVAELKNYMVEEGIFIDQIDFVDINNNSFKNYFLKIKPFYM